MQQTSNFDKSSSRRSFIRSATGLLLAAPVVSSLISCGKAGTKKSTSECPNAPTGAVSVAGNYIGGFGFFTHEPPVGGGSGSFFLELPYVTKAKHTIGSYDIYPMDKTGYTGIAEVKIITELRDQGEQRHITDITYSPWGAAEFWIWLEAAPGAPPAYCEPVSTPPHVKLLCNSSQYFEIHVDNTNGDILNHEPTYKNSVPHRYKHTGKVLGDHFRISKWAIVDSATQSVIKFHDICDKDTYWSGCSSGEDSYRFYVLLGDTNFRLRWL